MKILIVDDEELQCELLKGFLEKQGYEVLATSDPQEALRLFEEEPVWLVLLDQKMPGLSGQELLERLKRLNPEVRAIMITAYGAVDTAVEVMKLGADDFLEKPIDLEDLLARIRRLEEEVAVAREVEEALEEAEEAPLPLDIVA